jgi:hypothetical protein
LACTIGAWTLFAMSVQKSVERRSIGPAVKPIWLLMTRCTVPPFE